MSFCIRCQACNQAHSLTADLYESRVKDQALILTCRTCGFENPVDTTGNGSLPELPSGAEAKPLSEADFRETSVDELGDEEVASLPPSAPGPSAAVGDATPPAQAKGSRSTSKGARPPLPVKKPLPAASLQKPVALSRGLLFQVDDSPKRPATAPTAAVKGARIAPRPPLKASGKAVTRDLDFTDLVGDSEPPLVEAQAPTTQAAAPAANLEMVGLSSASSNEEVAGPPSIDMALAKDARFEPGPTGPTKRSDPHPPKKAPAPPTTEDPDPASCAPEEDPRAERRSGRPPRKRRSKAPGKRQAGKHPRSQQGSERPAKVRARTAPPVKTDTEQEGRRFSGLALLVLLATAVGIFFWMRASKAPPESEPPASATQTDNGLQARKSQPSESSTAASTAATAESGNLRTQKASEEPPSRLVAKARSASSRREEDESAERPEKTDVETSDHQPKATKEPERKVEQPNRPRSLPTRPKNEATEPFSKSAAIAALDAAVVSASACRQEGDPSGTARVTITFSPSGRVTSANLSGPPFAGTRTGGCIASRMRTARVPPFAGSHVTVSKSVVIR